MIEAIDIAYEVKGRPIVFPTCFTTNQEEFIVVLGPNGAGKSTLLRMLSGGLKKSSGELRFFGKDSSGWLVEDLAMHRAYMDQESIIASGFSVREVLEMARYRFKKSGKDRNAMLVNNMMDELNLEQLAPREYNSLSGGEKQRVQFGRCLLQLEQEDAEISPVKYLFLDEPLNNLDIRYQIELLQLARKFVDEKRGSVLVVMHDMNLCYQFADRVLLMNQGRLVADGKPEEVMDTELLSQTYGIALERSVSLEGAVFFRHQSLTATYWLNQLTHSE